VTERVCKTCCWWARENSSWGVCQLEPLRQGKGEDERCRHHSFTTGWLETDELPEDELPHGIDRSPNDFWKSPEHEPPSDLDAKVKALSERCKEARRIMVETVPLMGTCPAGCWGTIQTWLAGDDE